MDKFESLYESIISNIRLNEQTTIVSDGRRSWTWTGPNDIDTELFKKIANYLQRGSFKFYPTKPNLSPSDSYEYRMQEIFIASRGEKPPTDFGDIDLRQKPLNELDSKEIHKLNWMILWNTLFRALGITDEPTKKKIISYNWSCFSPATDEMEVKKIDRTRNVGRHKTV